MNHGDTLHYGDTANHSDVLDVCINLLDGSKNDRELQAIHGRLDRAREVLVERILMAQVGLAGNLRGKLHITVCVLTENKKNETGTWNKAGHHVLSPNGRRK